MLDETTLHPPLAQTAALLGDPARARMLTVLMDGRARTANASFPRHVHHLAGHTPSVGNAQVSR